ncbi:hypothetical protein [Bacillus phage vB_BanS-Thrax2]|nr:hypothetical protein [Bacillus phage vB_BanS-Thrax2]
MLSRRPVVVRFDELKAILGLPKEVNIYNVGTNRYGELEFEIVSQEPIEGLTHPWEQEQTTIRRIGVNGIKDWNEKNRQK